MNVTRNVSALASILAIGLTVDASAAEITQSGFSPLYVGVDYETAIVPTNPTASGAPTTSRAYITRIDLRAPGIALIATPHSGPLNTTSEPSLNSPRTRASRLRSMPTSSRPAATWSRSPKP
jgi:hypothetical protein